MAGPVIAPTCQDMELSAMARGRISRGTRFGASACNAGIAKARATPSSAATPNSSGNVIELRHVSQARVAAQNTSSAIAARAT